MKHNPNYIQCYIKAKPGIIDPENPNHQTITGEELRRMGR